ncbi:hypothetical protein [Streptomyces sp. URMC 129]|uniref:hypothetical protein n=1 Tax=Streptomyces sp. URMC 129 TaxID=3423407 RepID=UPI003F1DF94C
MPAGSWSAVRALVEAYRVLRPGGLLAAVGISRYASLFEPTALTHLHVESVERSIIGILKSRVYDGRTFSAACFHSADELRDEIEHAGFQETQVFGVEGRTRAMLKATERYTGDSVIDTPLFRSALTAARMAETYPELLAASSHFLAIAGGQLRARYLGEAGNRLVGQRRVRQGTQV